MAIEITEGNLLELLAECLPILAFACGGGVGAEEVHAKVKFVFELTAYKADEAKR